MTEPMWSIALVSALKQLGNGRKAVAATYQMRRMSFFAAMRYRRSRVALYGTTVIVVATVLTWTASAQVGPPCCSTPEIVTELSSRPPDETIGQLIAWANARAERKSNEEVSLEITAIDGACATGCSAAFRLARQAFREQLEIRTAPTALPPCCENEPRNDATKKPVVSRSANTATETGPSRGGPRFRSEVLRALIAWKRDYDDVQPWLERKLPPLNMSELQHLREHIASACATDRACAKPVWIGQQTVERTILDRKHKEELTRAEKAREEERNLRKGDWLTTFFAAVAGGLIALAGTYIPLRHARRQSEALARALSQLATALNQQDAGNLRKRKKYSTGARAMPRWRP